LEFVIQEISERNSDKCTFEIITPSEIHRRGAQLSIMALGQGRKLFDALSDLGVIADWREPNVIRLAPVPLYTSFEDIYHFGQILKRGILDK